MKIKSLQISNVLSFKYFEDISQAPLITFDDGLNIIIGENGAGKSTALEVLNFIFKRVFFKEFSVNQEQYFRKNSLLVSEKKQILRPVNNNSYGNFRLEPNWHSEDQDQKIKFTVELDEIDLTNLKYLKENRDKLNTLGMTYGNVELVEFTSYQGLFNIEVSLNRLDKSFSATASTSDSDPGLFYLVNYNLLKELIKFYQIENPQDKVTSLYESFTLIGGYRNYHNFHPAISLRDAQASQQIQQLESREYSRSLNDNEQSEPSIFNLVRLRLAEKHYSIFDSKMDNTECEAAANKLPFLKSINKKLRLIKLRCKIRLVERRTWEYAFEFFDTKAKRQLTDINSLSAGQKAIIHLIFEAYGRGDLKGGLVIIDEPEIHLHYQFQNEYLHVIEELNKEQNCQYVLVTHSESLINSKTIDKVKRFALDDNNFTLVKAPGLSTDQKTLIKILDNTRSTFAFFAKKVVLVEGDTDRYFFKAVLQEKYPELNQEIAIIDIEGKGKYQKWKNFFEGFGLSVYFIADLDYAHVFYNKPHRPLKSSQAVIDFKKEHTDIEQKIQEKYTEKIFILKNGNLEYYLGIHNKGLPETIKFCNEKLQNFLQDDSNENSKEFRFIMDQIIK